MNVNQKCYYFEDITLKETGFFDNIIDCCYVLTMENSKRSKNINYRLSIMGYPCKKIRIQYNKGFRNCQKVLKEQKINFDLADSYYNVFLDSVKNKYNNILVLEDDFVFTHSIKNKKIIKDIENLYKNKRVDVFNLGLGFSFINPFFYKFNCHRLLTSFWTHSIIYNKSYYLKFIDDYKNNKMNYDHVDSRLNFFVTPNIYSHKNILCVQSFKDSENIDNWCLLGIKTNKISSCFIKLLGLDKDYPIQGFKNIRRISYFINILLYVGIIYLIYLLFSFLK